MVFTFTIYNLHAYFYHNFEILPRELMLLCFYAFILHYFLKLLEMYKNASENSENYQGILLLDQKML